LLRWLDTLSFRSINTGISLWKRASSALGKHKRMSKRTSFAFLFSCFCSEGEDTQVDFSWSVGVLISNCIYLWPRSENFLVRSFRDGFRDVRGCRFLVHLSVKQGTYAVGSTPTGAHIANLIGTFLLLILAVNFGFFSDVKPSGSRPARERLSRYSFLNQWLRVRASDQ